MDQNRTQPIGRIAIIGFGEVGPIFGRALTAAGRACVKTHSSPKLNQLIETG